MDLKDAFLKAKAYFQSAGECGVACAMDAQTHWIFYGGHPDVIAVGSSGVKIHKKTGLMENFILPDAVNFVLLDHAERVDVEEIEYDHVERVDMEEIKSHEGNTGPI